LRLRARRRTVAPYGYHVRRGVSRFIPSTPNTPIHHLDELSRIVEDEGVELGIVAVPGEVAQRVVDRLVDAGIRAILNFAPLRPQVPEGIRCKSVDLKVELESLSFFLAEQEDPDRVRDELPAQESA